MKAQGSASLPRKAPLASEPKMQQPAGVLPPVASKTPTALNRIFELRRAEFVQLFAIDCVEQSFKAQIFVEFIIYDGALDESLVAYRDDFPLDAGGKPTFRPSALWYLKQLDFNNAVHFHEMEHSMRVEGNDILLSIRFEGVWFQKMELMNFPFDMQMLTASLAMNVRTTGMTPATFVVPHDAKLELDREGFSSQEQAWNALPKLKASSTTVGPCADRQFPTLQLSAVVLRRSGYFTYNIIVPMAMMPLLGAMQFAVPRDNQETRLSISLSLLVTTAAYKFSIATMMPSVSYLTFIDKYVMASALLLSILTFEGSICGYVELQISSGIAELVDYICLLAFSALYLLVQMYFLVLRRASLRSMRVAADEICSAFDRRKFLSSPRIAPGPPKEARPSVPPATEGELSEMQQTLNPYVVHWLHHSSESKAKATNRAFSTGNVRMIMSDAHG